MLLILQHKIRCFVVISLIFTGKVDAPVFFTFTIGFSDIFCDYKTFSSMAFFPQINNKRDTIF